MNLEVSSKLSGRKHNSWTRNWADKWSIKDSTKILSTANTRTIYFFWNFILLRKTFEEILRFEHLVLQVDNSPSSYKNSFLCLRKSWKKFLIQEMASEDKNHSMLFLAHPVECHKIVENHSRRDKSKFDFLRFEDLFNLEKLVKI